MDNIKKVIGQRINAALAMRDIKQKILAKEIGVQDNAISYFVKGARTPNTEQIIKIAKYLNVSADYLLGLADVQTLDIDTKAICERTGLPEAAHDVLFGKKTQDGLEFLFGEDGMEIVGMLLTHPKFGFFINYMIGVSYNIADTRLMYNGLDDGIVGDAKKWENSVMRAEQNDKQKIESAIIEKYGDDDNIADILLKYVISPKNLVVAKKHNSMKMAEEMLDDVIAGMGKKIADREVEYEKEGDT